MPPSAPVPSPPVAPAPAPGTVGIKGKVISLHTKDKRKESVVEIKILQVLKYGAATPAIVPQDTLKVHAGRFSDSLMIDQEFTGSLNHQHVMEQFKDEAVQWYLIEMKDTNNKN